MFDLVIANGTVVTAETTGAADLGITGGRIAALGLGLQGAETIDARGLLVLPGAVDEHVHLQMPVGEFCSSDDFATGTVAAAHGGTTTILDFAEPGPQQPLVDALLARRAEAEGKVAVDYGLHMTLSRADDETLAQVPDCIAAGAASYKLYMAYDRLRLDDGALLRALARLGECGGRALVHAENHHAIAYLVARALAEGHTGPQNHPTTRPAVMEAEAVHRLLALAHVAGTPVVVAHLSCALGLEEVRAARRRGQTVWVETCPQYLLLDEGAYRQPGFEAAKLVMAPPPRTAADRDALWAGLAAGEIDTVATDHCPFFFETQKVRGRDDFSRIPGGAPGIETRLALMYSHGVRTGRLSLRRWVDACCTEPARRFGLAPRKGTLATGADADVVLFDPEKRAVLSHRALHQNVDYTPYEGWEVRGYPVIVISRGEVIVRNGQFVGQPGRGRFVATAPL
ncbi:MAG: dihydropyrimidinase [Anaerolineae bacterium]|jgi:dihydropyrimidinase|nr:dihydropyrimidinase [Anaerolineae bacterium]